ncbi:unnamed protein product, partial [marine sediment metagenome]
MRTTDTTNCDLLERAAEHCFWFGVGDFAERLARANAPYGIAKIHWAQEQLGLPPDATFVSAPDVTVTRNAARWEAGIVYGGRYQWSGDLFPLELKPNYCGATIAGLVDPPDPIALRERCAELTGSSLRIEGVALKWNFHVSNHFVNVYRVPETTSDVEFPFLAYLHGSAHELQEPTELGPGLYWDRSEVTRQMAERIETPWGPLHVLVGNGLQSYLEFCRRAEAATAEYRCRYVRELFSEAEILFNGTHQGALGTSSMLLGC